MSTISQLAVNLIDAQTPGSTPKLRAAVLFEVVSEYCREVLQKPPPSDFLGDEGTWLTDAEWTEHHTTIISGVLARMHAMANKPWSNVTIAQAHAALYQNGFTRSREYAASSTPATTGYGRLMQNLRVLIPLARDPQFNQELFNVVEELQRNIRQAPVPRFDSNPDTWLTEEEYETYFRLLLAGTLQRLYGQSGKGWTDAKAEVAQRAIFNEEVIVARSDAQALDAVSPTDRLLSSLRAQLPGIKDTAIYPVLFDVIDEACRQAFIWSEVIRYKLTLLRQSFTLAPDGCDIVRVANVYHSQLSQCMQVDPIAGTLTISTPITEAMLDEDVVVRLLLAPVITSRSEDAVNWIPFDMWGRFHQLFMEGCVHKLMLQTAKPWSDARMGAVRGQVYRRLLVQATQEARTSGLIPKAQNWSFPGFTQ